MIVHRPMTAADRTFVCDGWVASLRTSYDAGPIDMENWHSVMWAQVERYIDRPDVRTVVAFEATDPAFLYGFICADTSEQVEHLRGGATKAWPAFVYYVFVKAPYRRSGVARGLFEAIGIDPRARWLYGWATPLARDLKAKIPQAKKNPLPARFGKEPHERQAG
jgi:GNAT superfamily N-acetyltransferase